MTLALPKPGRRAIEPTSIDKVTSADRFEPGAVEDHFREVLSQKMHNMVNAAVMNLYETPWNMDALMRARGYTANPKTCIHHRKTFRCDVWLCSDCGVRL